MKNGRINERNTGRHKLDGGAKRVKLTEVTPWTNEQYKANEAITLINKLLSGNLKIYDNVPELVQHWINRGIAEVKEFENSCVQARIFKPFETRVILNENRRKEIELVKNLLINFYKL